MRILVVEDEHRIADNIKEGLEGERYVVDVAYDGEMGLDLASDDVYDIVILDLMLPKIDGLSLCKKLRASGNNVPILILTAKGQVEDKVQTLDGGADDYLTKPFSFEELLARIRALARRPKNMKQDVIRVSDLSLDTKSFEVKKSNRQIKLSLKEYSFLEYLMRNSGRVVSKGEIIDHVWDYDSNVLPNTVEVYVRKLREKGIDIRTVRGFGYEIV